MTFSRFRAEPREGHLSRVKRVFSYLERYKNCSIKFRTDRPDYFKYKPMRPDWAYIYENVFEEISLDVPEPLGLPVDVSGFHDANLLHDLITGRSATGMLAMLNKTPVEWYSKRQPTVETATYGSEFNSARTATDILIDIRYALRMLGARVEGPSHLFGDNQAVIKSSTIPESLLKKRHNVLAYHQVRECIAAGIIAYHHIASKENPADVLTKFLPHNQMIYLMGPYLHWLTTKEEEKPKKH